MVWACGATVALFAYFIYVILGKAEGGNFFCSTYRIPLPPCALDK
jgi:hypothetical protein